MRPKSLGTFEKQAPELVLIRVLMTSLENKLGPFFSTLECQKFVRRLAKVTKNER